MRKHHLLPGAGTACLLSLLLFPGFPLHCAGQFGAANQWTWMSGSNNSSGTYYVSPGVYGELGVPSLDNQPGGRGGASTWTDIHGRLWLFGGTILSVDSKIYSMNDLWEFDPSTNQWTWQGGSSSPPCSVIEGNAMRSAGGVWD